MDYSQYDFVCQKYLYFGLQITKSLGHNTLEVEHIAYAMLISRDRAFPIPDEPNFEVALKKELETWPKVYGGRQIGFGVRLDAALNSTENEAGTETIGEVLLWENLCRHSQFLSEFLNQVKKSEAEKPANPSTRNPRPRGKENDKTGSSKAQGKTAPSASSKGKSPGFEAFKWEKISQEEAKASSSQGDSNNAANNSSRAKASQKPSRSNFLDKYTVDISAKAGGKLLDPVIGRDKEIRRVLEVVGRKKKNNPVLIGEAGVGKTAVIEGLAEKIAAGEVPEAIKNKRILSLDMGLLLAGTKYRGEFEDRLTKIIENLKDYGGEILLFIDELHMLIGAGSTGGGVDAANLLKPALARGELHCIGATTIDEYRKYIETDAALSRRFEPILIKEPGEHDCIAILSGLKHRFEIHHGVKIEDDAIQYAVPFTKRFLPERRLPDKAIDVIDEACSRLKLELDTMPNELQDLKNQIFNLEMQKRNIGDAGKNAALLKQIDQKLAKVKVDFSALESIWKEHNTQLEKLVVMEKKKIELANLLKSSTDMDDYEFASRIQYFELPKLDEDIEALNISIDKHQEKHTFLARSVGKVQIAKVIADITNIPVNIILNREGHDSLDSKFDLIDKKVVGQGEGKKAVYSLLRRIEAGIIDPSKPMATMLFHGPTGTGKTEMAKVLAEVLFGDDKNLIRIDMSEYSQPHMVARLLGSPPGYVGYNEGGELTEPVFRLRHAVVLLDEIEKADPRVYDILLQLFDEGRLTDSTGKTVNFKNCLIIMTTNLELGSGSIAITEFAQNRKAGAKLSDDERSRLELMATMKPELVGRIDEIIEFSALGEDDLFNLLQQRLTAFNLRLSEKEIGIEVGPRLQSKILQACLQSPLGARTLLRHFQSNIVDEVAMKIVEGKEKMQGLWQIDLDEDGKTIWTKITYSSSLLSSS